MSARWRTDNRTLGKFHLTGIPAAPRGVPQVEVTFDIDANGILNVSAKDRATGKEQAITISASSGLAKEEVEKLVKDAAAHATEDHQKRELVDQRNQADILAYQLEKLIADNRGKLAEADVAAVELAVAEARKAAAGDDASAIKSAVEKLTQASHKLGELLYKQAGSGEGAPAGAEQAQPPPPQNDVVDAEYTVKGN